MNEMEHFLDLLNSVMKKNNSTFHSCEPELIELMRQIDEMIELKNKEWKNDIDHLETTLEQSHNENVVLVQEIEHLKKALSEEKKSHSKTLSQYEKDVKQLKDDMGKLKLKYLELQKKIEHTKKKQQQEHKNNTKIVCQNCNKQTLEGTIYPTVEKGKDRLPLKKNVEAGIGEDRENLILKLKLESVMLENSNLRSMLKEQTSSILEKSEKEYFSNNTLIEPGQSTSQQFDDTSSINSSLSMNINSGFGLSTSVRQNTVFQNKPFTGGVRSGRSSLADNESKKAESTERSLTMGYYIDDKCLEDKLNNVISQFETVSSSFLL